MSRIGKTPIYIPEGVTVEIINNVGKPINTVRVAGGLGVLSQDVPNYLNIDISPSLNSEQRVLNIKPAEINKKTRSMWGLYRTLINNMVVGVSSGYRKDLEIHGIGYRAEMKGTVCVISVGLSHKITFEPPSGITLNVTDQVNVSVSGFDKQLVGEVAAKIRSFRKPEPYKGKGIRYKGEVVKKKSTKSGK